MWKKIKQALFGDDRYPIPSTAEMEKKVRDKYLNRDIPSQCDITYSEADEMVRVVAPDELDKVGLYPEARLLRGLDKIIDSSTAQDAAVVAELISSDDGRLYRCHHAYSMAAAYSNVNIDIKNKHGSINDSDIKKTCEEEERARRFSNALSIVYDAYRAAFNSDFYASKSKVLNCDL